jgi:DNA-directed RNA polymerase subunit RPC12/RpoP
MDSETVSSLIGAIVGLILALCFFVMWCRLFGAVLKIPDILKEIQKTNYFLSRIADATRKVETPSDIDCPSCGKTIPGGIAVQKSFRCPHCRATLENG